MKPIEDIRKALNEANVFPDNWQDWARGIEDALNDILDVVEDHNDRLNRLDNMGAFRDLDRKDRERNGW